MEFLRNSTGSWKSLRDSHSSHRAYNWALSSLTVSFQAQPQDVVGTHSKPGSATKVNGALYRDGVFEGGSGDIFAYNCAASAYLGPIEIPYGCWTYELNGEHGVDFWYWDPNANWNLWDSFLDWTWSVRPDECNRPEPVLTDINPSGAWPGDSGVLTIYGQYLSWSPSVSAGSNGVTVWVNDFDDFHIDVGFQIDIGAQTGPCPITVTTLGGSASVQFIVWQ